MHGHTNHYPLVDFGHWDPVENSSLVPWIILVAAAHLMLIFRARKIALRTTFVYTLLSFLLILYSTYLTRSGILGDTSVHAFAGGLDDQILFFILFFTISSVGLFLIRFKDIPSPNKDEDTTSREFWLFISSVIWFVSAFQITWFTSLPVINKVFGTQMAPPIDAIALYNSWQTPFAVIIILLIAVSQYLSYGKTDLKKFLKQISLSLIISGIVSVFMASSVNMWHPYTLFYFGQHYLQLLLTLNSGVKF